MDRVTPPCAGETGDGGDPGYTTAHFDGGPRDTERIEFRGDPPDRFPWPAPVLHGGNELTDYYQRTDLVTGDGCPVYHWTGRRPPGEELPADDPARQFAEHRVTRMGEKWWRWLPLIPSAAAFLLAGIWLPSLAAAGLGAAVLLAATVAGAAGERRYEALLAHGRLRILNMAPGTCLALTVIGPVTVTWRGRWDGTVAKRWGFTGQASARKVATLAFDREDP